MKRYSFKKSAALCLMAGLTAFGAQAQETQTGYFMETTTNRHQMNPAFLTPYVGALISNINVEAEGNVGLKNFVYKLQQPYRADGKYYDLTTFMNPEVSASQFLGDLPSKVRMGANLNYNIASVAFKAWGGVNLIELNARAQANVSAPKSLFDMAKTLGEDGREYYQVKDVGMRSMAYGELALGHTRKFDNVPGELVAGAKLKFLIGTGYADFKANNVELTMNGDYWDVTGDARLKAGLMNSTYEFEGPEKNDPATGRRRLKGIDEFSASANGFGMAVDLGATYRFESLPQLQLSASLTDLGFINYSKVQLASSAGHYRFEGFDNIYAGDGNVDPVTGEKTSQKLGDQFENLGDDLEEIFSVYDDGTGSVSQALAATLNVGADFTMPSYDKLHFGLLFTSRFAGKYSRHQAMFSAVVHPISWLEVGGSATIHSFGTNLGAMLSLRGKHINFFIGADSFVNKMGKQGIPLNNLNANVNLGLSVPL